MKIYLQNNKLLKINLDILTEKSFLQYIKNIQYIKRVFSEESILEIRDDVIRKLSAIDVPMEYGKIQQYDDHDYYQSNDEVENDPGVIAELSIVIDKSIISYEQVYRIPPNHVSEDVIQYSISLNKRSRIKMILDVVNQRPHDMYFFAPDDTNIQDICSTILNLIQLVKI